jgi:dsRNA-specific ribonuclease
MSQTNYQRTFNFKDIEPDYDDSVDYPSFILNEKNKYITRKFIQDLMKRYDIDYKIKNIDLFQKAMTHTSYLIRDFRYDKLVKLVKKKEIEPIDESVRSKAIPLQEESYERLEFLGDSVIHMILADYLYNRYNEDEGFLTKLRTKIENGQTLSSLARTLGLHEYVLVARNIEQIGGRDNNDHIFEDTFESLLGALYIDSKKDYPLCERFVISIIETHIDLAHMIHNETNYKELLLQFHHKMKWPDPNYGLVEITEKGNKKYFNMYVKGLNEAVNGHGIGTSKKRGEQMAAKNALIKFDVLNDESDDEDHIYEVI